MLSRWLTQFELKFFEKEPNDHVQPPEFNQLKVKPIASTRMPKHYVLHYILIHREIYF